MSRMTVIPRLKVLSVSHNLDIDSDNTWTTIVSSTGGLRDDETPLVYCWLYAWDATLVSDLSSQLQESNRFHQRRRVSSTRDQRDSTTGMSQYWNGVMVMTLSIFEQIVYWIDHVTTRISVTRVIQWSRIRTDMSLETIERTFGGGAI